jgi:hypothetical protein
VRPRLARSRLGCLLGLALLAAVGLAGFNLGSAYLRFYRFRDVMRTEARFASRNTDEAILAKLRAAADSLGLPPRAKRIQIRRRPTSIRISTEYVETVELPFMTREVRFAPVVEQ